MPAVGYHRSTFHNAMRWKRKSTGPLKNEKRAHETLRYLDQIFTLQERHPYTTEA